MGAQPQVAGLIAYHCVPGYKYATSAPYKIQTKIRPPHDIVSDYIWLSADGLLWIKAGYAWDGCSGPTYDDRTNQRGGLVHDALYQLMREGHLDRRWRKEADKLLYQCCREDGMPWPRARAYYRGVRVGGEPHTHKTDRYTKIHTAP